MESSIYFSTFVICMGTLHLVNQLAASAYCSQPHSPATLQTTQKAILSRDNWYMFFNCSTLTQQYTSSNNNHTAANHQETTTRSYQKRTHTRLTARTYVR